MACSSHARYKAWHLARSLELRSRRSSSSNLPVTTPGRRWWRRRRCLEQAIGPLGAGLLAQYAPDPARLTFFALSGLLLASLMSITLIPETVSRSARAAGGRGQRIGVPAAIRPPFLVASVAVIASFGALGLVAALGPKFVASLLHVDNRAVGGAVVFAMLSASAIAQLDRSSRQ